MTQPTKHTPAPWIAHPSPDSDAKYHVFNGDGDYLTLDDSVHEANARLITAAPDLLEAAERACIKLKELADDYPDDNYWNECIESLNAAIAKATKGQ